MPLRQEIEFTTEAPRHRDWAHSNESTNRRTVHSYIAFIAPGGNVSGVGCPGLRSAAAMLRAVAGVIGLATADVPAHLSHSSGGGWCNWCCGSHEHLSRTANSQSDSRSGVRLDFFGARRRGELPLGQAARLGREKLVWSSGNTHHHFRYGNRLRDRDDLFTSGIAIPGRKRHSFLKSHPATNRTL